MAKQRTPSQIWHDRFREDNDLTPLRTYEENGKTITVYPPRYANGVWPQHNTWVPGGMGGILSLGGVSRRGM